MILLDHIKGLSDSKWSGIKGSVAECVGLDIHSTPGLTQVRQKLSLDSGATVTEFCKVAVAASNGSTFWFSADSGRIWTRSSRGTWALCYTTAPAAGGAGCLGAREYNEHIYWATERRLHRIPIAEADDNWGASVVNLNWATFSKTDPEFHPMTDQDLTLWIGDGNQIASVNSNGSFTANALDINEPLRIKTIIDHENDILLGTFTATTTIRTQILRWDTVSPSFVSSDPIEEVGINALIRDDNYVYAQAGRAGRFYLYDGENLIPFKRLPGVWSDTQWGEVYPNSWANYQGVPVFGFSNGAGNPAKQGVYSFGSYSRDYPKVMDLSWVNSQDKTSSQQIGAAINTGGTLLIAWKDGTSFGVDAVDPNNKYASASFETMMLFPDKRDILKILRKVYALYETLPSGTSLTFSYKINHGAYVTMTSVTDSILAQVYAELSVGDIGALQLRCAFGVSGNSAPTIEGFGADVDGVG